MFSRVLRPLAAAALMALGASEPASAAPVKAETSYVISLGGIYVAELRVTLDDDDKRYRLDLDADVTGLAQFVAQGTAKLSASGRSDIRGLAPERFDLRTVAGGEGFEIRIGFSGGNATEFVVSPPILDNTDRVPLERSHLRGVTDMLSAFIVKGGALDSDLCRRKAQVFTGMERFDVAMSFAKEDRATSPRTGYQGPLVLCNIKYTPISGHYTSSEITNFLASEDRILIWYAPLRDSGYFIPYRVLMSTSLGDISMVLTSLR